MLDRKVLCMPVIAFIFAFFTFTGIARAAELKFAMSPRYSNNKVYDMMNPLLAYLEEATGEKFMLVYPRSYDDHIAKCRSGEIDISYSNPVDYIKLAAHGETRASGFKPLVSAVLPYPESDSYWGQIVVRTDSGIKDVSQLKGKKGMYVAASSIGGYLSQVAALKEKGIDVKTDLDMREAPSQKQDIAVAALYNGSVDFIFVRNEALKVMETSVDISKIQVIFETSKIPQWVISVSPQVDPKIAQKIKKALLWMDPAKPDEAGILESAKIAKWKEAADSDYDSVRALADKTGVVW
jgi:phosphonate transport system substrate-binding protein